MTATYDLATDIGRVRLNIPDTNTADAVFTDEDLQGFLYQEHGNIFLAAADAVSRLAVNQAYILKVRSEVGFSVDGTAVSAELRASAEVLRAQGRGETGSATVSTGVAIVRNHRMLRGY